MEIFKLCLLAVLELAPFSVRLYQGKIDYLAIILAGQFIGYTLELLLLCVAGPSNVLTPPVGHQTNALLLCTSLTLIGFYGMGKLLKTSSLPGHHYSLIEISRKNLWLIFSALLVSFAITGSVPEDSTRFFLNTQFILSVFLFSISVPEAPWLLRCVKGLVLVGSFYSFLILGNLGFLINLLVIWLAIAFLYRTRYPWIRVGFLLIPLVALQWVKADYRGVIHEHPEYDAIQRAWIVFRPKEARDERDGSRNSSFLGDKLTGAHHVLDRVRDASLQIVLQQTPSTVPYWRGRSYENLIYLLVPGEFWPQKPAWNVAHEFGMKYGILARNDAKTEVVFSVLAEAYMNFGYLFMLSAALGLGILIAGVERLSALDLEGRYLFPFICFLMPMLSYQSDLGSMLVKLIYTAIVLGVGPHRLLRRAA